MKSFFLSILLVAFGSSSYASVEQNFAGIDVGDIIDGVMNHGHDDGYGRGDRHRPPRRPQQMVHICTHKPDQLKTDVINCNGESRWASGVMIVVEKNDADIDFVDVFYANGRTERLYRFRGRFREGDRQFDYFQPGRIVRVRVGATSPNIFGKSRLQVYLMQR